MVKLTPDEQELFVQIEPEAFQPVRGGSGRLGRVVGARPV